MKGAFCQMCSSGTYAYVVVAIFTNNTAGSLWVPFELGAAYEADKGIGTYIVGSPEIPEYLKTFPLMKSPEDLNQYIYEYKQKRTVESNVFESINKSENRTADDFIYRLKSRLGQ